MPKKGNNFPISGPTLLPVKAFLKGKKRFFPFLPVLSETLVVHIFHVSLLNGVSGNAASAVLTKSKSSLSITGEMPLVHKSHNFDISEREFKFSLIASQKSF